MPLNHQIVSNILKDPSWELLKALGVAEVSSYSLFSHCGPTIAFLYIGFPPFPHLFSGSVV